MSTMFNTDQPFKAAHVEAFASRMGFRLSAHEKHMAQWLEANDGKREFKAAKASDGTTLELNVLDTIGGGWFWEGVTGKAVKRALDNAGSDVKLIRVLIDSPGGSVFDGVSICNLLKRHAARVEVEVVGEAASAASVVAMSGDKISIHEGAMFMVHRASSITWGFASDMRTTADALDEITKSITDIYATRTGLERAELDKMVTAETWLTASRSVDFGFADAVIKGKTKVAPATTSVTPEDDTEDPAPLTAPPTQKKNEAPRIVRASNWIDPPKPSNWIPRP